MKLLIEEINDARILKEDKDGKQSYFIEGIFLQSKPNRNGRLYPYETLQNEVRRYHDNFISKKRAFGEFGHPATPTIQMERISHLIVDLRPEGRDFIGKAKIINEGYGKIAKALLDEGAMLGVSSRGVGSLQCENNVNVVQPDFMLTTAADIVADPSAPDAFVQGVMEHTEWILGVDGEWRKKIINETKQQLYNVRKGRSKKKTEQVMLEAFDKLLCEFNLRDNKVGYTFAASGGLGVSGIYDLFSGQFPIGLVKLGVAAMLAAVGNNLQEKDKILNYIKIHYGNEGSDIYDAMVHRYNTDLKFRQKINTLAKV